MTCKCHGMSGSCNQKTCWHDVADIKTIGNVLKEKYDFSQKIKLSVKKRHTDGGHILEQVELKDPNTREKRKVPPDDDLWWIQKSPNFCKPDRKKNILGTSERECDPTSDGEESCKKMCCGRGYFKEQFKVHFINSINPLNLSRLKKNATANSSGVARLNAKSAKSPRKSTNANSLAQC